MNKTIIIAEAGVNHNGDIETAKKLIDAAADSGVDYIKFQTFKADRIVTKNAKKADYQIKNQDKSNDSQFNMLKKLELTEKDHYKLIEYCKSKKIKFMSSAFDIEGLKLLNKLNLDFFKIPSGEITNYPYLNKISKFNKKVVLSTGMSNINEIKAALDILTSKKVSLNQITVLHCNTEYPTCFSDVNLNAMINIKNTFNVNIGYSDHTLGIEVPIAATALGAKVIEKHFTLDRNMPGPDHAASLNPTELKSMVKSIRNIENALSGTGLKTPSNNELKNIIPARKSIVAKFKINKGEKFSIENLTTKRPGNGICPMKWNDIIGKKAIKNYEINDMI
ncbi:N-acetylneuraminate synthase [Flavobacteriaceae bacterium]|nr:N-acetylneuraminate synthase [Flavobacteriaceae bacterium]